MVAPKLDSKSSIEAQVTELIYCAARLAADGQAAAFAPRFEALHAKALAVRDGRDAKWAEETKAQAVVDAVDYSLDALVTRLSKELLFLENNKRDSPRFRLYFRKPASQITALGLDSEKDAVSSWVSQLKGEPEAQLKAMGQDLEGIFSRAEAAIERRATAISETAVHRARVLLPFVMEHNRVRQAVHAALSGLAAEENSGLGSDWADSFFKRGKSKAASSEGAPEDQGASETP